MFAQNPAKSGLIQMLLSLEIEEHEGVAFGRIQVAGMDLVLGNVPEQGRFTRAPVSDNRNRLRRVGAQTRHDAFHFPAPAEELVEGSDHGTIQVRVSRHKVAVLVDQLHPEMLTGR